MLDGLRLVAALMVVSYHYIARGDAWSARAPHGFPLPIYRAGEYGFLGVELFFLISGFVIGISSIDRGVGDFFIARVVRLAVGWRWLTVAGSLTYPLYLLHQHIGWAIIDELQHRMSPPLLVGLVLTAMLGLAWLVHRYVERPLAARMRVMLRAATAGHAARRTVEIGGRDLGTPPRRPPTRQAATVVGSGVNT